MYSAELLGGLKERLGVGQDAGLACDGLCNFVLAPHPHAGNFRACPAFVSLKPHIIPSFT